MPFTTSLHPPREICIVMLSAIGDAVHVLPVTNAIKRAWPECRITWIIQPAPYRLVQNHPSVDEFVLFRRHRGLLAWRGFSRLQEELAGRFFDLAIGLQVYFKAGLITAILPARAKLGFDRARARDLNWLFTQHRIPAHPGQHVQDQYLEFLHHLGIDPEPVSWGIELSDDERLAQANFFQSIDRPVCAIVLGTSKDEKNWTVEGYARVLEELESTYGFSVVLAGGPSPKERAMAEEVVKATAGNPINALGDDLRRLVYILEGSALTISPDTGPLHISRALDTPVIGLYGHTNPKRTGPYRRFTDLVVDGYARYAGEDYPLSSEYRNGMRRITVEAVLEKVDLAIRRYGKEGRAR